MTRAVRLGVFLVLLLVPAASVRGAQEADVAPVPEAAASVAPDSAAVDDGVSVLAPALLPELLSTPAVTPAPAPAAGRSAARGGWLPAVARGVGSWLRTDLPRHRRVLVYELTAGDGGLLGHLSGRILLAGLALLSALGSVVLVLRHHREARPALGAAETATPAPAPRGASRSEQARRLLDGGAPWADAARETGLAREALELLVRMSGPEESHEAGQGRPWARRRSGAGTPPATVPPAAPLHAPFHAADDAAQASPRATYSRPR